MFSVQVLHRVAAVVAALALAVPASAGFRTSDRHDTMCPQMQEPCGHHSVVLTCCCDQDSRPASTPSSGTPSSQGAPGSSAAASTAAPPVAIVPVFAAPSQSALRLASPPHGYRTTDLPVLFSTFLI
jgi:hypothetical protein